MNPTVSVDASEAVRYFADRVERARNLRPLFEDVAEDFHERQREVFATAGRSQGTPWAPLKPSYLRWRLNTGRGSSLLRYTTPRGGLMFRSLTERGGPQQIRQVRPDELRVGTRVGIAGAHQRGGGVLPARPLVNLTPDVTRRWTQMLMSHLLDEED